MANSSVDLQMNAHKNITECITDLTDMPDLSFQKIHDYFVDKCYLKRWAKTRRYETQEIGLSVV